MVNECRIKCKRVIGIYFYRCTPRASNLSFSDLSKRIGESPHHVSQVINEKLGNNFFELLTSYRIEKVKTILAGDKASKLTIEEISDMVGYNAKTAFTTPSRSLPVKLLLNS